MVTRSAITMTIITATMAVMMVVVIIIALGSVEV
jgi:hypothetical protein